MCHDCFEKYYEYQFKQSVGLYVGGTTETEPHISAKLLSSTTTVHRLRIQLPQSPAVATQVESPAEAIPGLGLKRGMVSKNILDLF